MRCNEFKVLTMNSLIKPACLAVAELSALLSVLDYTLTTSKRPAGAEVKNAKRPGNSSGSTSSATQARSPPASIKVEWSRQPRSHGSAASNVF